MKRLLCTFLLLATFLTSEAQRHSVTYGVRTFRDRLLAHEVIKVDSKFLRVNEKDYIFDQKNSPNPATITYIVVTDQKKDGSGGYTSLIRGGPHQTFAVLHFKSQRGRKMNFVVDIYGYAK